jgi:hypothetical protein
MRYRFIPLTSAKAETSIDAERLYDLVYEVIRRAGPTGVISDAVRFQLPGLAYSSVTARYRRLLDDGRIGLTGHTRAGASGRQQRVMVADVYAGASL